MNQHIRKNEQGFVEYLLIVSIVAALLCVFGMLYGDNLRYRLGRTTSALHAQEYSGHGPSQLTESRARGRTFGHLFDARIRQDQYNRKDERMQSRKTKKEE